MRRRTGARWLARVIDPIRLRALGNWTSNAMESYLRVCQDEDEWFTAAVSVDVAVGSGGAAPTGHGGGRRRAEGVHEAQPPPTRRRVAVEEVADDEDDCSSGINDDGAPGEAPPGDDWGDDEDGYSSGTIGEAALEIVAVGEEASNSGAGRGDSAEAGVNAEGISDGIDLGVPEAEEAAAAPRRRAAARAGLPCRTSPRTGAVEGQRVRLRLAGRVGLGRPPGSGRAVGGYTWASAGCRPARRRMCVCVRVLARTPQLGPGRLRLAGRVGLGRPPGSGL